ncbi:MAG TPA: hypothetical protein DCE78_05295 [Bacteroidetes bacterium]|nr:hypothetical protein [Bacteroidota bacterium]
MNINELILVSVQIVVILILLNIGLLFIKQGYRNRLLHKYMLAVASFLFSIEILVDIIRNLPGIVIWEYSDLAHDWIKLVALVCLLSGLGLLIRQSKPKVTRAPVVLAFLPFLLLLAYPLVMDTFVIKQFMFSLLFTGAVIISVLMYSILTYRERKYQIVLLSLVFFIIAIVNGYLFPSILAFSYFSVIIALFLYRIGYKKHEFNL